MANGSISDPFTDLATAFENPRLKSGHTIYLLDGVHLVDSNTACSVGGVTIKANTPLLATLDLTGAQVADGYGDNATARNYLLLQGAGIVLEDLIIRSLPQIRTVPERFLYPLGIGSISVQAASPTPETGRATFKRCILIDLQSVGVFSDNAGGVVAEDCILNNFGQDATSTGDGELFYTQNDSASPSKIFRRNLLGRCFGLAVQLYAESAPRNWHYLFEDITFLSELYALAGQERNDVTYRRLLSWQSRLSLGGGDTANTDLSVVDCYVAGQSISVSSSAGTVVTGNTVVRLDSVGEMSIGLAQGDITVDNNHYYGGVVLKYNNTIYSWNDWQNVLGFDLNGSWSADLPATNQSFVVPSDGTGYVLGQLTVYNWEELDSVTVDLADLGVTDGQQVKLRSIDDPLNDVRTLTVSGTSVTVDMTIYDADTNPTGRTQSIPHGHDAKLNPAQDIRFGAWRVETA